MTRRNQTIATRPIFSIPRRPEVVCLQHEFGIFGGRNGSFILNLLKDLRKPLVTTLHSLGGAPEEYSKEPCDIVRTISQYSTFVVVIVPRALTLLRDAYGVREEKIVIIPHGGPDVPFFNPSEYKASIQAKGRPVILTFGLLSSNKGIEIATEARGSVAREIPEVMGHKAGWIALHAGVAGGGDIILIPEIHEKSLALQYPCQLRRVFV